MKTFQLIQLKPSNINQPIKAQILHTGSYAACQARRDGTDDQPRAVEAGWISGATHFITRAN